MDVVDPNDRPRNIAIACQGGGSHAAFVAGALQTLLPQVVTPSPSRERFRLVGISGTSGGAMCALIAWHGLLTGGAETAVRNLQGFWDGNAIQSPGEWILNQSLVAALDLAPFDLQFSPYDFPLLEAKFMATNVWPRLVHWWPPFQFLVRADFFRLDNLIRRFVGFDLARQVSVFCSIVRLLQRWRIAVLHQTESSPDFSWEDRAALERLIAERLGARVMLQRIAAKEPQGLLARAFPARSGAASEPCWDAQAEATARNIETAVAEGRHLTQAQIGALEKSLVAAMNHIPLLLIGAVDIGSGEFAAFSSDRAPDDGGVGIKAVLASAALPTLFQAIRIDRQVEPADRSRNRNPHEYWDGLFSQNPPVKDFIAGQDRWRKPAEVWLVQINPQRTDKKFNIAHGIWDRRNELAGNISLNQEISFIDAINKRLASAGGGTPDDQPIDVLRLTLDSTGLEREFGGMLGPGSKQDRSARLMHLLLDFGRSEADAFRAVRDFMEEYWNEGRKEQRDRYRAEEGPPVALTQAVDRLRKGPPALPRIMVDDLEVHHGHDPRRPQAWRVLAYWHGWSSDGAGRALVRGRADFRVEGRHLVGGTVDDVWIVDFEPATEVTKAGVADPARAGGKSRRSRRKVAT